MKKIYILLGWLFLFQLQTLDAQTAKQFNSWWMYFGNHRLSDKIGLHTEYQFRRSDFAANWQQSLMRVGLDYYLPNNAMLTAGYGWIESFPYGEQPIDLQFTEHRIWEQLILKQNIGRFYFHHRYRLEQRFLENVSLNEANEKIIDGFRFRQRGRYRFLVSVPITKKKIENNTLFFATYEEVFLGFGKGIAKNILDQNRLYFALGWQFNKAVNLQLGYLNHHVVKGDGVKKENNHTFQMGLTYNLNFQ
ncbi:MAG: DUF2490 domain-containing protein [Saprospiraceae bacterium]